MESDALRILLLTQWFDPEPAFKGLTFARKLVERGHEVEVLTGFPNYPAGKLYPGYRVRLWQKETVESVSVVRVPLYPSHDRSALRRGWNYLSFAIAATVLGPALVRRPDVIYAYHPPGTIGLPALALGRWFGVPVVYDVQDLWPDTIAATGMLPKGAAMHLLDRFCRFVYQHADRVVALSTGFCRTLIERGVSADRLSVIYNWAPDQQPALAGVRPPDGKFRVVFAGNIGIAQGLEAVLDAAALCTVSAPAVEFQFVGGGVDMDRLRQLAARMQLANVRFLEWQSPAAIQAILRAADALLVHLKDDPLFAITIPSKTQAYLAAGRPIVMAVRGDAADLVMQAAAGVLAEPDNPDSIAAAVRQLAKMPAVDRERMGQAGRAFYERELAIDRAMDKFDSVFQDAVNAPEPPISGEGIFQIFHVVLALGALLVLWPVLLAVALTVRIKLGSPILFRQVRIGRRGRRFRILKFRTMRDAYADGRPLPDDERLTSFGRMLRSTSLDELPGLWNVIRGDMSMVGPRPLLPQYLPRYTPRQQRRHEVKPGITGWAQIHGRNAITWEEKFELDVWYIDHRSCWLDLKILVLTIWCVCRRQGIGQPGYATMPEFMGSENR
jgi:lipopolysaccharide/colanic/teichoic acid biosynthesis glycosyltransferase/glycosyltransferase involved in cell wall biosynthesis